MVYDDLVGQYMLRESKAIRKDGFVAKMLLDEYSEKHKLLHQITGNYIEDLLYNYFLLRDTENGKVLESLMNKYKFNYSTAIHDALYYLLGKKEELWDIDSNPLLWPGINKIKNENEVYILDTVLGEIKVSKASEVFRNTNSNYIFDRPLMGKCHSRSYDFIKENKEDYRVILSYMPNFFSGGYYHTYLESDTSVLDIAANSYYELKEDSSQILNGTIIKILNYDQIERTHEILSKTIPELNTKNNAKLMTLSLYYDYNSR